MRTFRVYTDQPLLLRQTVTLEERPSHHLASVLRVKAGTEVVLFNGEDGEYFAQVTSVKKRSVEVHVKKFRAITRQSSLEVELGIGLSKGDRLDWIVQKSTELGVASITPLRSEFSDLRLTEEREAKKMAHWRQIIIAACEQSGLNTLPKINPVRDLNSWIETCDAERKIVLHPELAETHFDSKFSPKTAALLIGPVGGFSDAEVERATNHSFVPLTLGPRVMRTETAPVAALSILQWFWGDFN